MGSSPDDLRKDVDGGDGILTVRGSQLHRTWQRSRPAAWPMPTFT